MKKNLTSVAPLRAGIVLGILYAFFGLLFMPFIILVSVLGKKAGAPAIFGGMIFAFLMPIIYAVVGFIGGVIAAALYNLIAKWTGGLEFEVNDAPTGMQ